MQTEISFILKSNTVSQEAGNVFTLTFLRMTIDNPTSRIYGTPTNTDLGNFTVTLRLYDDYGKESFHNVNVEIRENLAPILVSD